MEPVQEIYLVHECQVGTNGCKTVILNNDSKYRTSIREEDKTMLTEAIRCPYCGAELNISEDHPDYTVCESCGTTVQLQDIRKVEFSGEVKNVCSGKVVIDRSREGRNLIRLGNMAFNAGNYLEAYDYFSKGLVFEPDDSSAILRRGISAVRLSEPDALRIAELETAIDEVFTRKLPDDEASEILDEDLSDLLRDYSELNGAYEEENSGKAVCREQVKKWCELAGLFLVASTSFIDEELAAKTLAQGIGFIDNALTIKLYYHTHTAVSPLGKSRDSFTLYEPDREDTELLKSIRSEMEEQYKNLPSRIARRLEMQEEIDILRKKKDSLKTAGEKARVSYKEAKSRFWENNEELKKKVNRQRVLMWGSIGLSALFLIIPITCFGQGRLPLCSIVMFIVSLIGKVGFARWKNNRIEEAVFPDELKRLKKEAGLAMHRYYKQNGIYCEKLRQMQAFESIQAVPRI